MIRGRLGVVHPHWSFWAHAGGDDFVESRTSMATIAESSLATLGDIVWSVRLEPHEAPPELAVTDVIVVVVTMACPPTAVLLLLDAQPRARVVVWAASETRDLPEPFDHTGIVRRGATVGAPMVCAALTSAGRPFEVVADALPGGSALADAVRIASAAAHVAGATLGVVDTPLAGYGFTALSAEALAAVGTRRVDITESEFADRSHEALRTGDPAYRQDPALAHARAHCAALDDLVAHRGLNAGTLNCHTAAIRLDPELGTAPCLALGESTSRGRPWTCTGDIATAWAMLVVASLGSSTFYNEIEALDLDRDVAVLANSGEHDDRFIGLRDAPLTINPWYPAAVATLIRAGSVAAGPAALVAACERDGAIVLIVAEGQFLDERHPETGTMNAAFRFDSGPVAEAWPRWVRAGAGHHSCATDRRIGGDVVALARQLDVDVVRV